MRVLFLVSYITLVNNKTFTQNVTGYGHMVRDIADYVTRVGAEVDVVTMSAITEGTKYNAVTILRRTWLDIFRHANWYYLAKAFQRIKVYRPTLGLIARVLFYALSAGYVEHLLRRGIYDLVHIHGIGFATTPYIDCCERLGARYLVTLHGLNAFSDSTQIESGQVRLEKDFLRFACQNKVPLTVISTGILKVIQDFLNVPDKIKHFHVIPNGTDTFKNNGDSLDIRQKYAIGMDKEIMLCVGNLCKRKNQEQVVRAYALLPDAVKNRLHVLFLGNDTTNGEIVRLISELDLTSHMVVCGNIRKDEMNAYYRQASYTILASLSEGFGLSIIEGFTYGLPTLTYADLDAIQDLFDEKAMLIVTERSDEALAGGIEKILLRKWDKEFICQYAQNFSLEQMAVKYSQTYQKVVL